MSRILTRDDVIDRLLRETYEAGGIRAWSRLHGIHASQVDMVLSRSRPPGPQLLAAMKLTKIVTYWEK